MNDENGSQRGQPGYGDRGTQSQSQSQGQSGQSQSQSQPESSSGGSPQDESHSEPRTPETEPSIADYGGQGPAGDGKDADKDADAGTRPRDYENPPRDQQGQQPGADLAKAQEQGPLDK
mgnify:CR=1 FL=1